MRRFFSDLSTAKKLRPVVNENSVKPPVSAETTMVLESHLADEIDFYHFCRQRLHAQLRAAEAAGVLVL